MVHEQVREVREFCQQRHRRRDGRVRGVHCWFIPGKKAGMLKMRRGEGQLWDMQDEERFGMELLRVNIHFAHENLAHKENLQKPVLEVLFFLHLMLRFPPLSAGTKSGTRSF